MKYKIGTLIECEGLRGIVVGDNQTTDIYILWEHLTDPIKYEESFLDENAKILKS
jgi:hypothetical protein